MSTSTAVDRTHRRHVHRRRQGLTHPQLPFTLSSSTLVWFCPTGLQEAPFVSLLPLIAPVVPRQARAPAATAAKAVVHEVRQDSS